MASVRIKLNLDGIREVKKSPGMVALLRSKGEKVAAQARATATNEYYRDRIRVAVEDHPSGAVCHVTAWANNGMQTEAIHGTLARALGAA